MNGLAIPGRDNAKAKEKRKINGSRKGRKIYVEKDNNSERNSEREKKTVHA